MTHLQEIFNNLDRASDKLEHYFALYEHWFSKWVGKSPRILEIGIQNGGDSEMWIKYFGNGTKIIGVDIDPKCLRLNSDELKMYIGNQGDISFWRSFPESEFDLIIDDGSHENQHQIDTLLNTYHLLNDGGIYWCEDCLTSYDPNRRNGGLNNSKSFIEFSKNLIDVLHHHHHKNKQIGESTNLVDCFYENIQGVHFYDCVVAIEKGRRFDYNRLIKKARSDI
jgi:SAM-dependent methyltransferase